MRASVTLPEAGAQRSGTPPEPAVFRPDVEGLRAIAVTLVVLYHAGVSAVPGGYVGVDVFYVISGFLITGLLAREIESTGRISLRGFWARRVRRLLPVSTIVLITTAIATASVYAGVDRPSVGADIRAAALYVSNWRFAANAVDYLGADAALSPVIHYWSLSVEEQFYLCWPVLLVLLTRLAGRRWLPVVRVAILLIGIGSFTTSVVLTRSEATSAYYGLHTRAWELAVGAALALWGRDVARLVSRRLAAFLSTAALVLIAYAALRYSTSTPFPGSAALVPVLGAAALLASGARGVAPGLGRLLVATPITYVGRISYAWYLWHWPVLVLLRARAGTSWRVDAIAVTASFLLAAISGVLVERPVREARWLRRHAGSTLALGAVLTIVPVLVVGPVLAAPPVRHRQPTSITQASVSIRPATRDVVLAMTPTGATGDIGWVQNGCYGHVYTPSAPSACTFGDLAGKSALVLLGDSHAAALAPAVIALGRLRDQRVLVWAKPGCPFIDVPMWYVEQNRALIECTAWRSNVLALLRGSGEIDSILLARSWFERTRVRDRSGGALSDEAFGRAWAAATARMLVTLAPLARHVYLVADVPAAPSSVPRCVSANLDDVSRCNFSRQAGAHPDSALLREEAGPARVGHARFVDLTPLLCTATVCPGVTSDGLIVYIDKNHLTRTFSASLGLLLERAIAQATASPPTR